MPGLLRGVARTAVIAGTASAVNGRVQRRQAEKYADRDAAIAAERQQAYNEQMAPPPAAAPVYAAPAPAAAPPTPDTTDMVAQLRSLAELRDQGILTEEEFAAQKAKLLG
jgi:putative oligomerization/nucleic acid binding protein